MLYDIVEVQYRNGYTLFLRFEDGTKGEVDLSAELVGPVFGPLHNIEQFKTFTLAYHTLTWPNGADFAPEFLRERIAATV